MTEAYAVPQKNEPATPAITLEQLWPFLEALVETAQAQESLLQDLKEQVENMQAELEEKIENIEFEERYPGLE